MKNCRSILLVILILALFSCKTKPSSVSKLDSTNFVDAQSDKNGKPFFVGDSLAKATENWELTFSDEFNDNKIDTKKWTVENTVKKRVDVTLYASV